MRPSPGRWHGQVRTRADAEVNESRGIVRRRRCSSPRRVSDRHAEFPLSGRPTSLAIPGRRASGHEGDCGVGRPDRGESGAKPPYGSSRPGPLRGPYASLPDRMMMSSGSQVRWPGDPCRQPSGTTRSGRSPIVPGGPVLCGQRTRRHPVRHPKALPEPGVGHSRPSLPPPDRTGSTPADRDEQATGRMTGAS